METNDDALLRKAFGMALRGLRMELGFHQTDVAFKAQTTRGHLSGMETGRGDPKLSMIWRLAKVLGISPVILIRETFKHYTVLKRH